MGYFGKVPIRGDFVRRHLPRTFLDPWDGWLQGAMSASRTQLADAWLEWYLTSPIWRFCLSAGICSQSAAAGVLMPSVDSVGRYYPLALAVLLPEVGRHPFEFAAHAQAWFKAAEEVALGCLDKGFQLEALNQGVETLAAMLDSDAGAAPRPAPLSEVPGKGLRFNPGGSGFENLCPDVYADLLDRLIEGRYAPYSLWWTAGSDRVPPTLRVYEGLPPEADYAAFLSGEER